MSQVIKRRSSPPKPRLDRKAGARARLAFLGLYQDVVDELNSAVKLRVSQGHSRAKLAKGVGLDPATLSRVLIGRSGTNLRTVAAVLNATDHHLRVEAVPCEHLRGWSALGQMDDLSATLDASKIEGVWTYSLTSPVTERSSSIKVPSKFISCVEV